MVTFPLVGLLTADTLWRALLPAGLYLSIHIIEGETITPVLLARRFTLNPVLVIMAIILWHWTRGVPGRGRGSLSNPGSWRLRGGPSQGGIAPS
jgi:predicted PurR-regulated permease PerM